MAIVLFLYSFGIAESRNVESYLKNPKVAQRVQKGLDKYGEYLIFKSKTDKVCPILKCVIITWESQWCEKAKDRYSDAKGLGQIRGGDCLFNPYTNITALGNMLKHLDIHYKTVLSKSVYDAMKLLFIAGGYNMGRAGLNRYLKRTKNFPKYSYEIMTLYYYFRDEYRLYLVYGIKPKFLTNRFCEQMKDTYGIAYLFKRFTNSQTVSPFFCGGDKDRKKFYPFFSN
jgi:hypothetical protein